MIKKIEVYKNSRNMNLGTAKNFGLGIENDNNADTLFFEFDELVEGQASLLTDIKGEDGILAPFPLTRVENGYELVVKKEMLIKPKINIQLMITNEEQELIWHSNDYALYVSPCLETGTGEMPSGVTVWLEEADNKLLEVNNAITHIDLAIERETQKVTEKIQEVNAIEETYSENESERQANETRRQKNENAREEYIIDLQRRVDDGELDGISLEFKWQDKSLGIKREDEQEYEFVNLEGEIGKTPIFEIGEVRTLPSGEDVIVTITGTPEHPKLNISIPRGEKGEIKLKFLKTLPSVGEDNTLYYIEKENPTEDDNYDEYSWVNGKWESIGSKKIDVDLSDYYTKEETYSRSEVDNKIPSLTDYVKNTDYAKFSQAGVVKVGDTRFGLFTTDGFIRNNIINYEEYNNANNYYAISKGTLENVLNNRIGTIETALDTLIEESSL